MVYICSEGKLIIDIPRARVGEEILLFLADFALQEQPEDNLAAKFRGHGTMAHIPWPLSQSNRSLQNLNP